MKFFNLLLLGVLPTFGMNTCDDGDGNQGTDTEEIDTDEIGNSGCDPSTPAELMDCVDVGTYVQDLTDCAVERFPGSDGWQSAQDLCYTRLVEAGFDVTRAAYETGINVIGVLEGETLPEEQVILSAHYDHIVGCPGADDNASGVAGVLESARALAHGSYDRTLVVACWDEEERAFRGSSAYASGARANGEDIRNTYVFEMIGYQSNEVDSQRLPTGFGLLFPSQVAEIKANGDRGDFVAVIADTSASRGAELFEQFVESAGTRVISISLSNQQKRSSMLGDLRRSDHDSFWREDYPAMMITDTSEFRYGGYHCREFADTIDHLDHEFTADIIRGTVAAVATELGMRSSD